MIKVHLHHSQNGKLGPFAAAIEVPADVRDVIVHADQMWTLDAEATKAKRRPTYRLASWFVTGPIQQRAGVHRLPIANGRTA